MLCDYGCGQEAKFQTSNGKLCCSKHYSSCSAIKAKNSAGLKKANAEGRKGYTWNPASAWNKGKRITPNDAIFVEYSPYSTELVKNRIILNQFLDYRCSCCGIDEWQGRTIVLDLDHINGNNRDNRLENLRFLCPNCHSQTDTYKGRNKNTGKVKVTDQELLTALQESSSIRQALQKVGLAAKGANYERAKRLTQK